MRRVKKEQVAARKIQIYKHTDTYMTNLNFPTQHTPGTASLHKLQTYRGDEYRQKGVLLFNFMFQSI